MKISLEATLQPRGYFDGDIKVVVDGDEGTYSSFTFESLQDACDAVPLLAAMALDYEDTISYLKKTHRQTINELKQNPAAIPSTDTAK